MHFRSRVRTIFILGLALGASLTSSGGMVADEPVEGVGSDIREFSPRLGERWIGQAIAYGPYRKGQAPGGATPLPDELEEDLKLMSEHWNLVRIYGCRDYAEDLLQIIRAKKLPMRVMLGAWITRETAADALAPGVAQAGKLANRQEVMAAIRLANAYPEEVVAVCVGNETQVFWSDHRTQPEVLTRHIRAVRDATDVPVTTADDFNFWNKPESQQIANEVDFLVLHIHPMWAGVLNDDALAWTQRIYGEIGEQHPGKLVVIGETGWATKVHSEGEQAELIKGDAGEAEQAAYYHAFTDWAREQEICTFFFEAFDEPWKGGAHPNEVEKHWGLFYTDRTPKAALSR